MQGECRHGTVGVGILPTATAGGVAHREKLDYGLTGCSGPVHKGAEVAEVPDPEVILRTKGEHRHSGPGATEPGTVEFDGTVPAGEGTAFYGAVLPAVADGSCGHGITGKTCRSSRGGGPIKVMVLPFNADDEAVAQKDVAVTPEFLLSGILNRHAPKPPFVPGHRNTPSG